MNDMPQHDCIDTRELELLLNLETLSTAIVRSKHVSPILRPVGLNQVWEDAVQALITYRAPKDECRPPEGTANNTLHVLYATNANLDGAAFVLATTPGVLISLAVWRDGLWLFLGAGTGLGEDVLAVRYDPKQAHQQGWVHSRQFEVGEIL